MLCFKCKKQLNKLYRTALYQFGFSEPDVYNSAQLKMESMAVDENGHVIGKPYQSIHCHPVRTQAFQNRTMMNVEKYMVIQLEIFNYDPMSKDFSKTVPNLITEEKI